MWLEVGVGILLLLALAQSVLLFHGWRQLRELQRRVVALSHDATYACTDVPTSMLVTALGQLQHQLGRIKQQPPPTRPDTPGGGCLIATRASVWWSAAAACRATRRGWSCRCIRPVSRCDMSGRVVWQPTDTRGSHSSAAS